MGFSSNKQIVIGVDCIGGDSKDIYTFASAIEQALKSSANLKLVVFGSLQLRDLLISLKLNHRKYEFCLAQQDIPQDEQASKVLKNYKNSAMCQAIDALASSKVQAVVSLGGTGPLVALARYILGEQTFSDKIIEFKQKQGLAVRGGKVRPCFVARIPYDDLRMGLMLDIGANANSTFDDLYDFACLGRAFAQVYLDNPNPRVSLLNVGVEQGKGSNTIQQAQKLLKQELTLNYQGFIEANKIFEANTDVIVCEGFSGNIALKAMEGVCQLCFQKNKALSFFSYLFKPKWFRPVESFSNSILLGVNGLVIKAHASSSSAVLASTIIQAATATQLNLVDKMQQNLKQS